jgi:hypothetical protein
MESVYLFIIAVLLILCPCAIEIACILKGRRHFHIALIEHCQNSIKDIANEMKDDDSGRIACGYGVAFTIFGFIIALVIFTVINFSEREWGKAIISIAMLIILPLPFFLGLHRLNHVYIAFAERNMD